MNNLIMLNFSVSKFKLFYATALLPILFSCEKNKWEDEPVSPKTGTRTELTIDSLYLYAKEVYLWNDVLPNYSSFDPRNKYNNITPEDNALKKELFDIAQFKINESTKLPYEFTNYGSPKYSYLEETSKENLKATSNNKKVNNINVSHIHKLSYLAIHSFPQLNSIKADLDETFSEISAQNPSTLVIDLRYNSGGYIETAEYLANLMAPTYLNGKVIYSESFNQTLQSGNAKILKNQPYLDNNGNYVTISGRQATMADVDYSEKGNTYFFKKQGTLESVKNIYFIISGTTASASELLISSFKPYFNVKLVGQKTYGKPVGFFAINIDKYSIYMSSFLIKNATGWSDYFNGMDPHITVALPANPNLGDPEEPCLKSIISDLATSSKTKKVANKLLKEHFNRDNNNFLILKDKGLLLENRLRLKN